MGQSADKKPSIKQISFSSAMLALGTVLPLVLIKTTSLNHFFIWALEITAFAGLAGQFLLYLQTDFLPLKPTDYKLPKR